MANPLEVLARHFNPQNDFDFLAHIDPSEPEEKAQEIVRKDKFRFVRRIPKHVVRGALYGLAIAGVAKGFTELTHLNYVVHAFPFAFWPTVLDVYVAGLRYEWTAGDRVKEYKGEKD